MACGAGPFEAEELDRPAGKQGSEATGLARPARLSQWPKTTEEKEAGRLY